MIYPVVKNEKVGFISGCGELVTDFIFDNDESFYIGTGRDDLTRVCYQGKAGILDNSGKLLIPTHYENNVNCFNFNQHDLAAFCENKKYGYLNLENDIVVPANFDFVNTFHEGFASVSIDGKWAIIDQSGRQITDFVYDYIDDFSEGLVAVKLDGLYGYLDYEGKLAIAIEHGFAIDFIFGWARIGKRTDNVIYFINKLGQSTLMVFDNFVYSFNGYQGEYAVILEENNKFIDDIEDEDLVDGSHFFLLPDFAGVINRQGDIVVDLAYEDIELCRQSPIALVTKRIKEHLKKGILDIGSKEFLLAPIYDELSLPIDGLCYFKKNNQIGWLDQHFKLAIPPCFDDLHHSFGQGELAKVEKNGKIFYINRHGEWVSDYIL